jgi:light-regulated signal transduction histidine kinase (bacteriophytochrome)
MEQHVRERTAQLEAANKELEAFAYSVAHDLRAPLRSIDGFSLALLEDCKDKLDDTAADYLNRVRAATQRMAALIDDILNLSRITRGEMVCEDVNLSSIASETAGELRSSQPDRQVDFEIPGGIVVKGDRRLLRIVVENLLGNSWKFTGKHPSARIEFGRTERDGQPAYFVRDDGAGFDLAFAAKLFAPFQRLHSFVDFPGTGIGLAIVQRVVNRYGGRLWAESAVEKGATFYFTLQPMEKMAGDGK